MGLTQPALQWAPEFIFRLQCGRGVKIKYSSPSSAEVKNEWSYISTPPHAFMVSTGTLPLFIYLWLLLGMLSTSQSVLCRMWEHKRIISNVIEGSVLDIRTLFYATNFPGYSHRLTYRIHRIRRVACQNARWNRGRKWQTVFIIENNDPVLW